MILLLLNFYKFITDNNLKEENRRLTLVNHPRNPRERKVLREKSFSVQK